MADYAIHDTTLEDIADTIRKKDGTSALIDPADYADRINLMGMLDEKTASGAIANIQDGADTVPIKSWEVDIPANLDGKSSIVCYWAHKNLFPKDGANIVDGYIDTSSFNTGNVRAKTVYISIKGGATYTVSKTAGARFSIATSSNIPSNGATYTSRQVGNTASSLTITADANDKYLWACVYLEETDTGTLSEMLDSVQIEVGSSASDYASYVPINLSMRQLGRTVNCAKVDVISGQGIDNGKSVKLSAFTWDYITNEFSYGYFVRSGNITDMTENKNFQATGYVNNGNPRNLLADGEIGVYNNANSIRRICIRDDSCTSLQEFQTKIANYDFVYECTSGTAFTITPIASIPQTPSDNVLNLWADGDNTSSVVYRSIDTVQPIPPVPPTLISKNVTQNGTYEAEDDDADGYDEVTVNVPPYSFMPAWTETKLVDNSGLASSITFSEDYHNYQMLRFVIYNSSTQIYDSIFVLPSGIDKAFTYSSNKFCINQQITGYTNQYVTYQEDSLLSWSRTENRNCNVYEVYGMTFTNATMTAEVIYSRDALTSGNVTPTPPTGKTFFDYDAIIYMFNTTDANITAFSKWWITKPKLSLFTDSVGYGIPLFAYNTGKPVVFTDTSIGNYNFFYVVGINFT